MAFSVSSPLIGALGRRVSLGLGTVVAFVAVDLLLVVVCLFALRQNMKLRGEAASAWALLTPANGSVVPPLVGEDWTGAPQAILYEQDQRPTLVYAFSKNCGACQQNWRKMRSLQTLAPRSLRIVYIDTVGDKFALEYLVASGIGQSPLLVQISSSAAAYDARAVPQLLLVDHDGRVQWSHVGELAPADLSKALSLIEHD